MADIFSISGEKLHVGEMSLRKTNTAVHVFIVKKKYDTNCDSVDFLNVFLIVYWCGSIKLEHIWLHKQYFL